MVGAAYIWQWIAGGSSRRRTCPALDRRWLGLWSCRQRCPCRFSSWTHCPRRYTSYLLYLLNALIISTPRQISYLTNKPLISPWVVNFIILGQLLIISHLICVILLLSVVLISLSIRTLLLALPAGGELGVGALAEYPWILYPLLLCGGQRDVSVYAVVVLFSLSEHFGIVVIVLINIF